MCGVRCARGARVCVCMCFFTRKTNLFLYTFLCEYYLPLNFNSIYSNVTSLWLLSATFSMLGKIQSASDLDFSVAGAGDACEPATQCINAYIIQ